DGLAINESGNDGQQFSARRSHHRFVHEGETLREPSLPNQPASFEVSAKGAQVLVVVALADLGRLCRRGARTGEIARSRQTEDDGQPQVAGLDAVLTFA